ncbi:MAG: aromatic amino acid transport family protein [Gammaproteobacteria bacterium]
MLRKVFGGILLVAGTSVGAAVLALPVNTAHMGIGFASATFILCWVFMTLGALYLLEANLKAGVGANIISIAKETTGPLGQAVAWIAYLCLLYSLTSAYLTGGSNWIEAVAANMGHELTFNFQLFIMTFIAAGCIYLGTVFVDYLNRFLMIGLIGTYGFLAILATPHVDLGLLDQARHSTDLMSIPLIITAFGFAIIVPSLTLYLNGDSKRLVKIILIGSFVPLFMYILWEVLIFGLIPYEGSFGLKSMHLRDKPAADLSLALQTILQHRSIVQAANYFAIFALVTSLLGVTLSLFDFLADGFNISKRGWQRVGLILLTFAPPFLIVKYLPGGFTYTLKFAGIFVAILLGILPAWMVWQGRYHKALKSDFEVPGGKLTLLLTTLFFTLVVSLQINATLF